MADIKRVFSAADRPDGPMHIGHYVGSISNRLAHQGQHDQYIMIADLSTARIDETARNMLRIGLDHLAVGLDPFLCTLFIQSNVEPLVALGTLFTYAGMLPDVANRLAASTAFDADGVLVGADRVTEVEASAELVRSFNRRFGSVLVEPEPVTPERGRLPGTDGKPRMSRALGNAIYLTDSPDVVTTKVCEIAMTAHGAEFAPATSPPFVYLREFHPDAADVDELEGRYLAGQVDDFEIRHVLLDVMQDFLDPIRKRRNEFAADPAEVVRILKAGGERAAQKAETTLDRVRSATEHRKAS